MRIPTLFLLSALSLPLCAQSAEEAQRLHDLGRDSFTAGNVLQARKYTKQALDMRLKLFGEHHPDYITSLNNYALSFCEEKHYGEAVRLQERVMQLCDSLPQPHPNWGLYTLNMGRFYYLAGRNDEAAAAWEKALPRVEKFSEMYEYLLNGLALIYTDKQDQAGMQHIMELSEEHNRHELTKPCNEPKCMLERAQYYASQGNEAEARNWYLKALACPLEVEDKLNVHSKYAQFLHQSGDCVQAAEQMLQAVQAAADIDGKATERQAEMLHRAGVYYFLGKDFPHALSVYGRALKAYASCPTDKARLGEAQCHYDMGNSFSAMKRYEEAIQNFSKAVAYYTTHDDGGKNLPKAIQRQAVAEKFKGDYDASIEHHRLSMSLFKARGLSQEYADAARSLRLCYAYAKRTVPADLQEESMMTQAASKSTAELDRIIAQESAGLENTRRYLGQMAYATSLGVIGGCQALKGETRQAAERFAQYMPQLRDALRQDFRLESAAQRMRTWETQSTAMQQIKELTSGITDSLTDERGMMAGVAYDAALLSKGILLNSAIEFSKVLKEKGNARLETTYEQALKNSDRIEALRKKAKPTDDDRQELLRLNQANEALLLDLYKGCAELADFTDYLSYDWHQVQRQLSPTDVAIEFVSVKKSAFDKYNPMLALILTSGMEHPEVQVVGSLEDMNRLATDSTEFKGTGSAALWSSLSPWLKDKKRVFFSADGVLSGIGIEYLPYNGQPLSEQMEVYRLSSTKVLCMKREAANPSRAALFGDIDYNLNGTLNESTRQSLLALRGTGTDSEDDTLLFGNLPYTRKEVEDVSGILRKGKTAHVQTFMNTEASRKAFLGLSGSKVDVLHIATHGLFLTDRRLSDLESMGQSMLAFAGANVDSTSMVTAADVASMDLRHCTLAVLSACESGLGKQGSDGVFGLQRGFKNAGVHTLLMSLRKVYDASTARLMTLFYSNLTRGHGKRESLILAQQQLRKEGYTDMTHWASFILLDAW